MRKVGQGKDRRHLNDRGIERETKNTMVTNKGRIQERRPENTN